MSQEVQKSKHKMYRSLGRMFVLADPADIQKDLTNDIERINAEAARAVELQKTYEQKKATLEAQLNKISPQPEKK